MSDQPIPLEQLEVIGYNDVLPKGWGPAILPPIFRERSDQNRIHVPPFRIAGDWLVGGQVVSAVEAADWDGQKLTLTPDFHRRAQADRQLWVDNQGQVRYDPSTKAKQQLLELHEQSLAAAVLALKADQIEEAEHRAGIALAANERSLEARALLAACHAHRGEGKHADLLRNSAVKAGHDAGTFNLLLDRYARMIPASGASSPETKGTGDNYLCDLLRLMSHATSPKAKPALKMTVSKTALKEDGTIEVPVDSLPLSATLSEAMSWMRKQQIECLPVSNEDGAMVVVIYSVDVRRRRVLSQGAETSKRPETVPSVAPV